MKSFVNSLYSSFFKRKEFSQGLEESFLLKYFIKKEKGFFMDVGCLVPFRNSNTQALYRKGGVV